MNSRITFEIPYHLYRHSLGEKLFFFKPDWLPETTRQIRDYLKYNGSIQITARIAQPSTPLQQMKDAQQIRTQVAIDDIMGYELFNYPASLWEATVETLEELKAIPFVDLSITQSAGTLHDITPLRNMTELKELSIDSGEFDELSPLSTLEQLEDLSLSNLSRITTLSALAELPKLKTLRLKDCPSITELRSLKTPPALADLHFVWCDQIVDFFPLHRLQHLTSLYIQSERKIDLQSVESIKHEHPNVDIHLSFKL